MGAPRGQLLGMVIGHGLKLAGAGVAIGLLGALGLARLVVSMATMLYEVDTVRSGQLLGDGARAPRRGRAGLLRSRAPGNARGSDRCAAGRNSRSGIRARVGKTSECLLETLLS